MLIEKKKTGRQATHTDHIFFQLTLCLQAIPQKAKQSQRWSLLVASQGDASPSILVYSRSVRVKLVHSGSYSGNRVTDIHIGCNSCGCVFSPNEAWVEYHLLKPNQDFPSGARHPQRGNMSGPICGYILVHMRNFWLLFCFAATYFCVKL